MSNLTWLELYNFLHKQANEVKNIGNFDWNDNVFVYNSDTDETMLCDTFYLGSQLVLGINMEENYES